MRQVRVRHPDAGEGLIPETALGHYVSMGWTPVEEVPAEAPEQDDSSLADVSDVEQPE